MVVCERELAQYIGTLWGNMGYTVSVPEASAAAAPAAHGIDDMPDMQPSVDWELTSPAQQAAAAQQRRQMCSAGRQSSLCDHSFNQWQPSLTTITSTPGTRAPSLVAGGSGDMQLPTEAALRVAGTQPGGTATSEGVQLGTTPFEPVQMSTSTGHDTNGVNDRQYRAPNVSTTQHLSKPGHASPFQAVQQQVSDVVALQQTRSGAPPAVAVEMQQWPSTPTGDSDVEEITAAHMLQQQPPSPSSGAAAADMGGLRYMGSFTQFQADTDGGSDPSIASASFTTIHSAPASTAAATQPATAQDGVSLSPWGAVAHEPSTAASHADGQQGAAAGAAVSQAPLRLGSSSSPDDLRRAQSTPVRESRSSKATGNVPNTAGGGQSFVKRSQTSDGSKRDQPAVIGLSALGSESSSTGILKGASGRLRKMMESAKSADQLQLDKVVEAVQQEAAGRALVSLVGSGTGGLVCMRHHLSWCWAKTQHPAFHRVA